MSIIVFTILLLLGAYCAALSVIPLWSYENNNGHTNSASVIDNIVKWNAL